MLNTIDVLGEMSRKKVMIRPCRPERLPCATSLQPIERGAFPLRALKKEVAWQIPCAYSLTNEQLLQKILAVQRMIFSIVSLVETHGRASLR